MKIKHTLAILIVGTQIIACGGKKIKNVTKLANAKDSLSYAIGLDIGSSFATQGLDSIVDNDVLYTAIQQASDSGSQLMNQAESREFIQAYFQKKQEAQMKAQFGGKIESEKTFFAENKVKEGVQETASGLQYIITKAGNGPKPTATDQVTVHYHGTLLDGTVFDSSVDRGEPATFPVGGVIPGWVEALQLMPKGSKWKLFIPSELAYGARGAGQQIAPYSTLIFDVELLDIKSGQ
ncbi:MAG: FKBP-type peptidyl-prolyl cis-trans isomerase [Cyclobacteriaceae bacterium]